MSNAINQNRKMMHCCLVTAKNIIFLFAILFAAGLSTSYAQNTNGFNQNGITVAGGNGAGNALNQLSNPHDVFVDNAGNLFVAELDGGRVTKWAPGATSGTIVATGLNWPSGVHVDASGNVYVSERNTHRVTKWAPGAISGKVVAGGNGAGSALKQFNVPNDVYLDNNGNIFVTDRSNHRIMKWAPGASSGVIVAGGNGPGNALNQLNNPTYTGLDAVGNLYVSDRENDRVLKFPPGSNASTNGVIVAGGNGPGNGLNQIDGAEGLFITPDGTVYVTSEDNARIMKWLPGAAEGVIVAGGNGAGSLPNQFLVAVGVCLDAQGNMYVGDGYNHRVQKFTPDCYQNMTVYADADGDGYGNVNESKINPTCDLLAGYVANSTDCSDADASIHPNATEKCNGIDDNCNGSIDEISGLKTTNITATTATLNWKKLPGAKAYGIKYRRLEQSAKPWTVTGAAGSSIGVIISGLQPNTRYVWLIKSRCEGFNTAFSGPVKFKTAAAFSGGQQNNALVTSAVKELSVYPNPTAGNVTISATFAKQQPVSIKVFDLIGKEVYVLNEGMVSGTFIKQLDLNKLSPGTYFIKVIHNGETEVRKVVLKK